MAKRKIVWTNKANEERREILSYWIERNQSKVFSVKLNRFIIESLKLIAHYPETGRKTNTENVRVKVIRDYLLFYQITKEAVIVLTIWDGRRNEESLNIK